MKYSRQKGCEIRTNDDIEIWINPSTGEYKEVQKDQRLEIMDKGDRHIKENSINSYKKIKSTIGEAKLKNGEMYMSWNLEHYAKTNTDELRLLLPDLANSEKVVLFSILPYVGYDDCLLKYSNGRELNIESLAKISSLSVATVKNAVASLKSKDVLYKGKNSRNVQYFINPWICARGSMLQKTLKSMFKNYYIRSLDKKWGEI